MFVSLCVYIGFQEKERATFGSVFVGVVPRVFEREAASNAKGCRLLSLGIISREFVYFRACVCVCV